MTTTEQDKDPGIDDIMKANIPPEDKVIYIADLCKHRGKCMDADAETIKMHQETIRQATAIIDRMRLELVCRSPWDHFKIWMNGWAKS
jgi:hypothetical protein